MHGVVPPSEIALNRHSLGRRRLTHRRQPRVRVYAHRLRPQALQAQPLPQVRPVAHEADCATNDRLFHVGRERSLAQMIDLLVDGHEPCPVEIRRLPGQLQVRPIVECVLALDELFCVPLLVLQMVQCRDYSLLVMVKGLRAQSSMEGSCVRRAVDSGPGASE